MLIEENLNKIDHRLRSRTRNQTSEMYRKTKRRGQSEWVPLNIAGADYTSQSDSRNTSISGALLVNGAHPYENPTPLSNFIEMLAIVLLPAALTNTFGRMVGRPRQGWLLYYVMLLLFVCGLAFVHNFERQAPPLRDVDFRNSSAQSGGNMEGKEVRFGIGGSTLTTVVTSNTATGSYNSMHDSYTSLGGMVLLINMLLGELVFGGLAHGQIEPPSDEETSCDWDGDKVIGGRPY